MNDSNQPRGQKRKIPSSKPLSIATSNSSNLTTSTASAVLKSATATASNNTTLLNKQQSIVPSPERESQRRNKARPKPVFFWNNADVLKWLRRCCQEYHSLYSPYFFEHDITGRSLVRMTDVTLEKMGITQQTHREELCTEILKLKLKSDIVEMKDLEKKKEMH